MQLPISLQPIYQKSLMTLTRAHISFHNLLYHPCSLQLFLSVLQNNQPGSKCLSEPMCPGFVHLWGRGLVETGASRCGQDARLFLSSSVLLACLHDSSRWFPSLKCFVNLKRERTSILLLPFHFSCWRKVRSSVRGPEKHTCTSVKDDEIVILTSMEEAGVIY